MPYNLNIISELISDNSRRRADQCAPGHSPDALKGSEFTERCDAGELNVQEGACGLNVHMLNYLSELDFKFYDTI